MSFQSVGRGRHFRAQLLVSSFLSLSPVDFPSRNDVSSVGNRDFQRSAAAAAITSSISSIFESFFSIKSFSNYKSIVLCPKVSSAK